jgi:thioredoxin reductase (NADPH)
VHAFDANPLLCVVHDDADVRALLVHDLAERFGSQYLIEGYAGPDDALAALSRHADLGRRVAAVFTADSPACGGDAFRVQLRVLHPAARRVLLVGRGEWGKAHPAVHAMRTGQAESYIFVPWALRERWLYLPVTELLADWEASQRPVVEMARIVGDEWDPRTRALRDFLSRIGVPFGFYAGESDEARRILHDAGVDRPQGPVLTFRNSGAVLVDPSYQRLAEALGFPTDPEFGRCDLAIVGGGPAGLAAAVYGASEGLSAVVIDDNIPGGQAGTSSRIRNYLGFPTGLSGRDLTNRAIEQAWFFGARFVLSKRVTAIAATGEEYVVQLADGATILARTVLVATGVSWRRLGIPSLESLNGVGVVYGAAASDAGGVEAARVFVVGAGNSAGQAAVHLARSAASVTVLVRGDRLGATMSDYLVRQLEETPNIEVRLRTEIVGGGGSGRLRALTVRDHARGVTEEVRADALYVMIGARPHTEWLAGTLARDEQGYLLTGADLADQDLQPWPLVRPPMLLETSLPGVFAAGDVRAGSVKRVASAVGGGSIAVQLAHLRLAELDAGRKRDLAI